MKASARKVQGVDSFYGIVMDQGRPIWMCPHSHDRRKQANACARGHVRRLPRSGSAALRLLRESWKPHEVSIPRHEDGRPLLSRSRVENFLQCVQYQGDQGPDGEWGSVVHDAIYAYWQLCIAKGEESRLSDVNALVREAYFRSPGVDPKRYDEALRLVTDFVSSRLLEAERLLWHDRRPVIEFTLLADNDWCWLTGRVDRIDRADGGDHDEPPQMIRIRDYKTGWQSSGGKALDGAPSDHRVIPHEFQRRFYACLAFNDARINERLEYVETEIDYIRYRGEPEVVGYEKGELDSWWQDLRWGLAQRWQQRAGPPTGSAACEYCALRATCGAALTPAKAIPADQEQAVDLVQKMIRVGEVSKSYRESLQAFFKNRDAIRVNGLEVGYLRPRDPAWKPKNAAVVEIVKHLDLAGLNGVAATYPPGVASDRVPKHMKAALVDAGLATWDYGPPVFKHRKVGES